VNISQENRTNDMTLTENFIVIRLIDLVMAVFVTSLGGNFDAGRKSDGEIFYSKTSRITILADKVTHDNRLPLSWKGLGKPITLDHEIGIVTKDPSNNDNILV
jgi:hypothetical protein